MQPLMDETVIAMAMKSRQRFMDGSSRSCGIAHAITLLPGPGAGQSKTRRCRVDDGQPLMKLE
jgi:hypothetical protein